MDKNKANVPKIRFPGFTDPWEQRKLKNIVDVKSGRDYKHLSEGKIPVYGTGGYMLSVNEALSYKEDAIGIGRKGTIDKPYILRAPFWTVDTLFYAVPENNNNLNFVYDIFQNIKWKQKDESTGVPSLSKTAINNVDVLIPDYKEQKQIGDFFQDIDHLITLHQRKLNHLQDKKKGLLQKMFPKNGEDFPELRFPGFTDPWEQRKFGDLFLKNLEKNQSQFDATQTISIATMRFKKEGNGAAESSLSTYKVLRVGDIAYEGHTSKQFSFGRFVLNDIGDGIMSPRFTTLRPTSERPISFWKQYIHYEPIMRHLLVRSTKKGTMMNELVISDLEKEWLLVPSEEEQEIIGTFFDQIDHLITLHQRKLNHLQEQKKALLQQMFI
jgi:type I restriction enzyme S subunit